MTEPNPPPPEEEGPLLILGRRFSHGSFRMNAYEIFRAHCQLETGDIDTASIPINVYTEPIKSLLVKLQQQGFLTAMEETFIIANKGFFFSGLAEDWTKEYEAGKTLVSAILEKTELPPSPDSLEGSMYTNGCQIYGSRRPELLFYAEDLENYQAIIIGTKNFLVLDQAFAAGILNLGLNSMTEQEHLNSVEDFLHDIGERKDMHVTNRDSNIPILIEVPMHLVLYQDVHYLAKLFTGVAKYQEGYRGMILLLFPPFVPDGEINFQTYQEGKAKARKWAKIGMKLGQIHGVATQYVDIQAETYDRENILTQPLWRFTSLYSQAKPTTEFMRRFGFVLKGMLNKLQEWQIPFMRIIALREEEERMNKMREATERMW
jgi:hypothetical protein